MMQCLKIHRTISKHLRRCYPIHYNMCHGSKLSCEKKEGSLATRLFGQWPHNKSVSRLLNTSAEKYETVDYVTFEKVCEETLESLSEYFEELVESCSHLTAADVSYSSGVLTVAFGDPHGTYVINRQSPNRQIWLSSPTSGPKRYDFVAEGDYWLYKHDNQSLHQLLQDEVPKIVKTGVDFSKCAYARVQK